MRCLLTHASDEFSHTRPLAAASAIGGRSSVGSRAPLRRHAYTTAKDSEPAGSARGGSSRAAARNVGSCSDALWLSARPPDAAPGPRRARLGVAGAE